MRPERRDAGYLLDMLQYARGVARAVKGRTLEEYTRDEDFRLVVERIQSPSTKQRTTAAR